MIRDIQDQILRLKKEKDVCILAHLYQNDAILEVADYTGDSFALAKLAQSVPNKTVLMCGVRFMAETVKMLAPDKRVLLSNPDAGCPMAEQMDREVIQQVKDRYPDYTVVAYINTTAALKTVCDVCVTSSSAEKVISKIDNDKILFIPDCNLGDYVSRRLPDKTFKLLNGGCPTHAKISAKTVQTVKAQHPEALFLVHPECVPAVVEQADYVGSTTGIMEYAIHSDAKEFIIGTENSICEHLQLQCPDKRFYPLSKDCVCHNMKATTLGDVLGCLQGTAGEEITVAPEIAKDAVRCIDRMIALSE